MEASNSPSWTVPSPCEVLTFAIIYAIICRKTNGLSNGPEKDC